MPKVLFVNCSCHGSTGKIVSDIADYAAKVGFESVLCSPLGNGQNGNIRYYKTSLAGEQGLYRRIKYYTGYQYGFAPLSTFKIKKIIKKEKPDIVHLHCINGDMVNIYSLLHFLKKNHMRTVVTNHAEFFYTGSCVYSYDCNQWQTGCTECPMRLYATRSRLRDTSGRAWLRMKKAFRDFDGAMVSVSPFVAARAALSPITAALTHRTVLNGINTEIFKYRDAFALRKKHGIADGTRVLLHVTAHFSNDENDIKGGKYLLELAQKIERENAVILVAGNGEIDFDLPPNVIPLGRVTDQRLLADYYSMADLTVLTSRKETFSMPVAESLCCGTPVVGFVAGGPESIAIGEYCRFVPYADACALKDAANELLKKNFDKETVSRAAISKYDSGVMAAQYADIYHTLMKASQEAR